MVQGLFFSIFSLGFFCLHSVESKQFQTMEEALFDAVDRLDGVEVQNILFIGVDVNACLNGITPLCLSIDKIIMGYDSLDIIKQLFAAGASLESKVIIHNKVCTVYTYARESLRNYMQTMERLGLPHHDFFFHSQKPVSMNTQEMAVCIKRAKKALKLIERYAKH